MKLEKNMGNADRLIRSVVAGAIILTTASGKLKGTRAKILLALSGIFMLTSAIGSCPAYQAVGVDTLPKGQSPGDLPVM